MRSPCYDSLMQPTASKPEPCPHCGGRGWIVSLDSGAGRARPCSCRGTRSEDVVARLLEEAETKFRALIQEAIRSGAAQEVER